MPKSRIKLLVVCLIIISTVFPAAFPVELDGLPKVEFTSPPNFSITSDDHLDISGVVSSRFGIRSVYIDKHKAALKDGVFTLPDIPLALGKNVFLVRATDLSGNRKNFLYTIYREEPPKEPAAEEEIAEEPDLQADVKTVIDSKAEDLLEEQPKAEDLLASAKPPVEAAALAEKGDNKGTISGDLNSNGAPYLGTVSGTRIIRVYTNTTYKTDNRQTQEESTSEPIKQSVNSQAAEEDTGKGIVTFSSPYTNQVITENMLKIGGRFDPSANITDITVNGQPCTLDVSTGTFTGPMLLSPGEARRNNITSDSRENIILNVNPVTHSGKNILKVVITNSFGRTDKQEIAFYYYQLFLYKITEYPYFRFCSNAGPGSNGQVWNSDFFANAPFSDWGDLTCDKRNIILPPEGQFGPLYMEYYKLDNPHSYLGTYLTSYSRCSITYKNCVDDPENPLEIPHDKVFPSTTNMILHTPPLIGKEKAPLVLVFYDCSFLEVKAEGVTYPFPLPALDLNNYAINGQPLRPLSGNSTCYIILTDYTSDTDLPLTTKLPPPYEPGYMIDSDVFMTESFEFGALNTLTGDILVDSNNDGFLGGEDSAYEAVSPGCVFWVNSDDDYDESDVHTDDGKATNSSGNDGADEVINGIRDLEDFMPIDLTIPNIKGWKDAEGIKFYLKAEGQGRIRVFKRVDDNDEEGTKTYLLDLEKSKQQYTKEMKFSIPDKDGKNEIELTPDLFNSEGKFYGIFEGVTAGTLKLTLEVELGTGQDKKTVVLDEAYITLKDISQMYRLYNVRNGPTMASNDNVPRFRDKQIVAGHEGIFPANPDTILIWTHGYNNTYEVSVRSLNTIYKRLYRSGFRGGFIGVAWKTHKWPNDLMSTLDFNADWTVSYQTGHIFADIIGDTAKEFSNSRINVGAHSLGNNITCYALRLLSEKNETIVDNLIMAEAAVPGEVFSGNTYWRSLKWDHILFSEHYFEDIYGIDFAAVKGKIYNTYSIADRALTWAFPANNDLFRLPTPLDYDYNLIDHTENYKANDTPLGAQEVNCGDAYKAKFENETTYNIESTHPYGIRKHGSMMDEYYYDVQEFYKYLIDQKKQQKQKKEN